MGSDGLLQQLIPPCILTIACMLSARPVYYCLASFLMHESPFGFQTSVREKNKKEPKQKTIDFMDLECNKKNAKQL